MRKGEYRENIHLVCKLSHCIFYPFFVLLSIDFKTIRIKFKYHLQYPTSNYIGYKSGRPVKQLFLEVTDMAKKLVAYFSAEGTTRKKAEIIAEAGNCQLYEIKPKVPYTKDDLNWMNKKSRSSIEMADKKIRPEIEDSDIDVESFDEIILGFPIWWYVAPTIVNTFLEKYNLNGKKIVLFATSGGSGFGNTVNELKVSAPGADIVEGKLLNGLSRTEIENWVKELD